MLIDYIQAAMHHGKYELMENGRFFGNIPECQGAWGEAATLEECRDELQSALEDWIVFRLRQGMDVPGVDGIDLNPKKEYAEAD